VRAAIVVDGRVVGTWQQQRKGDQSVITVETFARLDPAALPGLEAEAADLGRFQRTMTSLRVKSR